MFFYFVILSCSLLPARTTASPNSFWSTDVVQSGGVAGCLLLVTGYWLLVTGYRLLTT